MKKTVILIIWMFVLIVGILLWLILKECRSGIIFYGPPAKIDSIAWDDCEASGKSKSARRASIEERMIKYGNVY